ncbi:MAG TPA: single-stranded DNA-binding protein [bacterium]|nr:single-stranded DNA-binding protein [bacterium]
MSRGRGTVNKVILVGRLGADPQLKYTPSGRANASFSLATNAVWKDQEGNQQERTDWHRITAWGKLAEIMGEYLKKGSYVYLEGRIQTRTYEDNNNVKKWITEVVVSDMEMLGKKGDNRGSAPAEDAPPDFSESSEPDDVPF